jgi:hypothetical protein
LQTVIHAAAFYSAFFDISRFIAFYAENVLPGVYVKLLLYSLAARGNPLQTDPWLMELYRDGVAIHCVFEPCAGAATLKRG